MSFVNRLNQVIRNLSLTSSQFADAISLPRPSLSQILNGRNKKISNEVIEKIHNAFPSINILWLLFGEGNMTIESQNQTPQNLQNETNLISNGLDNVDDELNIFSFDNYPEDTASQVKSNEEDNDLSTKIMSGQKAESKSQPSDSFINRTEMLKGSSMGDNKYSTINPTEPKKVDASSHCQKEIVSIMIMYSDQTYKIFRPSEMDC